MNLLITRHDKIGDFITSLPTFYVAKKNLPDTKIIALVSKINFELAQNMDFIDDVILYEDDIFILAKKIREKKIDVSISCFTDTKLALALLLAGVKKRFAPATKVAQIFSNHRIKQRRSQVKMREFEYNLELLKAFKNDVDVNFEKPLLKITDDEKVNELTKFKNEFDLKEDYKYVAFHPGYGGSSDGNLSIDDYIRLAKKVSQINNIKVVFTFGPDDGITKEYIQKHIDFDVIIYESKSSLLNFCKLLSNFEIFVSTSTGPMHLAGSVNIKTISFFGESLFASAARWATISDEKLQNNYSIPANYDKTLYNKIENRLLEVTQ